MEENTRVNVLQVFFALFFNFFTRRLKQPFTRRLKQPYYHSQITMQRAIDMIVQHAPAPFRHIETGGIHRVCFASAREVVTCSQTHGWLGSANRFIGEFEAIEPQQEQAHAVD